MASARTSPPGRAGALPSRSGPVTSSSSTVRSALSLAASLALPAPPAEDGSANSRSNSSEAQSADAASTTAVLLAAAAAVGATPPSSPLGVWGHDGRPSASYSSSSGRRLAASESGQPEPSSLTHVPLPPLPYQSQYHQHQQQHPFYLTERGGPSTAAYDASASSSAAAAHAAHPLGAPHPPAHYAPRAAAAAGPPPRPPTSSPSRGIAGLGNLGNTCFMNSILQCLSHVPPLRRYFTSGEFGDHLSGLPSARSRVAVTEALGGLLAELWRQPPVPPECSGAQTYLVPARLKRAVAAAAPRFEGYDQHDSHELLSFLVDAMVEGTNGVTARLPYRELDDRAATSDAATADDWWEYHTARADSAVWRLFAGQLKTVVTCSACGGESRAFDPFLDLQVALHGGGGGGGATLVRCLDALVAPEQLSGADAAYCRLCKTHTPSRKATTLYRLPDVLVIQLKRFSNSGWRRSKLETPVEFPLAGLDMARCCDGASPFVGDALYDCVAVSNHSGGLGGGHYTA